MLQEEDVYCAYFSVLTLHFRSELSARTNSCISRRSEYFCSGVKWLYPLISHHFPRFVDSPTDVVVTWSTRDATNTSIVKCKTASGPLLQYSGKSNLFVDGGPLKRSQYIHKVKLLNLSPNTTYGLFLEVITTPWSIAMYILSKFLPSRVLDSR